MFVSFNSFSRGPAVIVGPRPPQIYEVSKQWFSTFGSTPWNGGGLLFARSLLAQDNTTQKYEDKQICIIRDSNSQYNRMHVRCV
jgi:hypothetical protein